MKLNKIDNFAKARDSKEFAEAIGFRTKGAELFDVQTSVTAKTSAPVAA